MATTVLRLPEPEAVIRVAPHNIEAEQAILGAILVNNDAYYRVSDFLEAEHFSEDIHTRIYDICQQLIRAGKVATPVTLKTFLGEHDLGGMTVPQYLARLAAEATSVINAEDYGRTIYDLATRRQLINIGEEIVNTAYDSPVDAEPRAVQKNCVVPQLRRDGRVGAAAARLARGKGARRRRQRELVARHERSERRHGERHVRAHADDVRERHAAGRSRRAEDVDRYV